MPNSLPTMFETQYMANHDHGSVSLTISLIAIVSNHVSCSVFINRTHLMCTTLDQHAFQCLWITKYVVQRYCILLYSRINKHSPSGQHALHALVKDVHSCSHNKNGQKLTLVGSMTDFGKVRRRHTREKDKGRMDGNSPNNE